MILRLTPCRRWKRYPEHTSHIHRYTTDTALYTHCGCRSHRSECRPRTDSASSDLNGNGDELWPRDRDVCAVFSPIHYRRAHCSALPRQCRHNGPCHYSMTHLQGGRSNCYLFRRRYFFVGPSACASHVENLSTINCHGRHLYAGSHLARNWRDSSLDGVSLHRN